jgi:hypothetical protein
VCQLLHEMIGDGAYQLLWSRRMRGKTTGQLYSRFRGIHGKSEFRSYDISGLSCYGLESPIATSKVGIVNALNRLLKPKTILPLSHAQLPITRWFQPFRWATLVSVFILEKPGEPFVLPKVPVLRLRTLGVARPRKYI